MRLLMLCNGNETQTTGILFSDLVEVFKSRGIDSSLELRSFPRGVPRKLVALLARVVTSWARVSNVDGVVVHSALSLSLPEMVSARLQRKPVISFVWDIYPASTKVAGNISNPALLAVYSLTERLGYFLSTRVLVPSADYTKWIPGAPDKVAVYPLWPRSEIRECRPLVPRAGKRIVFAGQINKIRGLDFAVEKLGEAFPGEKISLDVYSRDELPESLTGLEDRSEGILTVRRKDFVPPDVLIRLLGDYDFGLVPLDPEFALPSFPSKLLTYLSAGVPIAYHGPQLRGVSDLLRRHNLGLDLTGLADPVPVPAVTDRNAFEVNRREYFAQSESARRAILDQILSRT